MEVDGDASFLGTFCKGAICLSPIGGGGEEAGQLRVCVKMMGGGGVCISFMGFHLTSSAQNDIAEMAN
jgi:hypothetical protein